MSGLRPGYPVIGRRRLVNDSGRLLVEDRGLLLVDDGGLLDHARSGGRVLDMRLRGIVLLHRTLRRGMRRRLRLPAVWLPVVLLLLRRHFDGGAAPLRERNAFSQM